MTKREIEFDAVRIRPVRFAAAARGTAFLGFLAACEVAAPGCGAHDLAGSGDFKTFANGLIGFSHDVFR